jgi:hypothetical protein
MIGWWNYDDQFKLFYFSELFIVEHYLYYIFSQHDNLYALDCKDNDEIYNNHPKRFEFLFNFFVLDNDIVFE